MDRWIETDYERKKYVSPVKLKCYSSNKEKICLAFLPCRDDSEIDWIKEVLKVTNIIAVERNL